MEQLTELLCALGAYLVKSSRGEMFQTIAELDLSMSQVRMLLVVDGTPRDPALHELAAELQLSLAATGRAADALVRAGLIGRYEDRDDRRVKRINLTDAGQSLVERFSATRREGLRGFAETLTDTERERLIAALQPIMIRPEFRALTNGPHC